MHLLGVALLAGCQGPRHASSAHRVQYRLDWTWDGATPDAGAAGWEVTTDLGYRVHVTRGYVTSYSMELVECPKDAPATPLAALGLLPRLIGEGTAHAGHSVGTPNPAAIRPMQVESLTSPVARQVGEVLLPPQAYCQLHYLIARAGSDALGLPADPDMVGTSLHVDGTYRAPGATADTPFTVHTAVANGGLFDRVLDASGALRVDTGARATQLTVRRHLGRMFDGVDFARMADRMVASRILKALIDHVEIEITSTPDHA